jgi:hypothetical protein
VEYAQAAYLIHSTSTMTQLTLLLHPRHLRAGRSHRSGRSGRPLRPGARGLRQPAAAHARVPGREPQGPRARAGTEQGTLTETPALLAYVAQRFPAAPGARRRLRPGAHAGVQQLPASTVHIAHAHRPARQPLGRRARGPGGHAAQGAGQHDRVLQPHRAPLPGRRPLGWASNTRGRRLPVHHGRLAEKRRRGHCAVPKVAAHHARMARARPCSGHWPEKKKKPAPSRSAGP